MKLSRREKKIEWIANIALRSFSNLNTQIYNSIPIDIQQTVVVYLVYVCEYDIASSHGKSQTRSILPVILFFSSIRFFRLSQWVPLAYIA